MEITPSSRSKSGGKAALTIHSHIPHIPYIFTMGFFLVKIFFDGWKVGDSFRFDIKTTRGSRMKRLWVRRPRVNQQHWMNENSEATTRVLDKKTMIKIWIELNGGEEMSHISWCTHKVTHPAKRLVLTETTHCHSFCFEIVFTRQRDHEGGVREYWLPLSSPIFKQRLRAQSSMSRDTNSRASAGVRRVSSVTSAGWLGLSRRPSSAPPLRRFYLQWLECTYASVEHLRHHLWPRIALDGGWNLTY